MPKSSMATRTPRFLILRRVAMARSKSSISTPSVISTSRRCGVEAGFEQRGKQQGRNVAAPEIDRRKIDRDRQRIRPRRRFTTGFPQHPSVDRYDRADFFRQRNEQRRRHHAPHRVPPAEQGFKAEHLASGQRLRLEMQLQFVLFQRLGDVLLKRSLLADLPVHRRLEAANTAAPFGLGPMQCRFGVDDQGVHIGAVLRIDTAADRETSRYLVPINTHRRIQHPRQSLTECLGRSRRRPAGRDDREFVGA